MDMTDTMGSLSADVLEGLKGRKIYLWGARQLGFSLRQALSRLGLPVTAFLDRSPDLIGRRVEDLPVLDPESILKNPDGGFIIITSGFFYTEIEEQCRAAGLARGRDFLAAADLQRFDYQIDVAGSCNLRCVSCPRGNFKPQPPSGFMSLGNFEAVLAKIQREDPLVGAVALYNFGEPLLHPRLPEFIELARGRGLLCAVSTNLNFHLDLTAVVKAAPAWFRVSTSGWGDSYEVTHTGGKWELFLANLKRLAQLRDEYSPDLNVEVFYHIYRHRQADYAKMRELCEGLGFTLRVRHAALAPLDTVMDFVRGRPLSQEAERTRELQILPLEEALELARAQKSQPCPYQRCLWITWDMKVRQCMEWFGPDLNLAPDFLQASLDEISAARAESRLCRECRAEALHRCYVVYGDETLVEKRRSLAPCA